MPLNKIILCHHCSWEILHWITYYVELLPWWSTICIGATILCAYIRRHGSAVYVGMVVVVCIQRTSSATIVQGYKSGESNWRGALFAMMFHNQFQAAEWMHETSCLCAKTVAVVSRARLLRKRRAEEQSGHMRQDSVARAVARSWPPNQITLWPITY